MTPEPRTMRDRICAYFASVKNEVHVFRFHQNRIVVV